MTKKLIVLGVFGISILALWVAYFQFNKPREEIKNTKAEYRITSDALSLDFLNDESAANEKYLGAIIAVSGSVTEIIEDSNSPGLLIGEYGNTVYCTFDKIPLVDIGDQVTVKGRCTGFLLDVVLNECVLMNKNGDD